MKARTLEPAKGDSGEGPGWLARLFGAKPRKRATPKEREAKIAQMMEQSRPAPRDPPRPTTTRIPLTPALADRLNQANSSAPAITARNVFGVDHLRPEMIANVGGRGRVKVPGDQLRREVLTSYESGTPGVRVGSRIRIRGREFDILGGQYDPADDSYTFEVQG
jgi:hypothetical protein